MSKKSQREVCISNLKPSKNSEGTYNMVPSVHGGLRKRLGYKRIDKYPGRINCIYKGNGGLYIHAADTIYLDGDELTIAVDALSKLDDSGGTLNISYDGPFNQCSINDSTFYVDREKIYEHQAKQYTDNYRELYTFINENTIETYAVIYNNYYIVFCPSMRAYAMDILTKEVYVLGEINARTAAVIENKLYFGDASGNLYEFTTDEDNLSNYKDILDSYTDRAIDAYFITKKIGSERYDKVKDFTTLQAIFQTPYSSKMELFARGQLDYALLPWQNLGTITCSTNIVFDFNTFDFGALNFGGDINILPLFLRTYLGLCCYGQFKIENKERDDKFNLLQIGIKYKELGEFY